MVGLFSIAASPRVFGAFFLPNAFGDAYVYIQEIGTLSTKISNGSFRLTDLFGFWLPLYQLIAAQLNVFVKNGFYSGKIVAAFFGAGTCLFVYIVTQRLTNDDTAALWTFLLIALNPLHIFYSASAMTDVPHAFFVVAALYFVLGGNWIIAAMFGALAGFTRVESWMLIALIPLLQFIKERRISIIALLILILPPLFWFYISWKATGEWRECFIQRQQYHDWLLQMNPAIAHFSLTNVLRDTATLLLSSDVAVLIATLVAGGLVVSHARKFLWPRAAEDGERSILGPVAFFFAFFALIFVAYLTHQQPIIFPRYGLILFTLGLPILAWTFLWIRKHHPQRARAALVTIITLCLFDAGIQFVGAVGTIKQYRVQRAVADYLRNHFDLKSDTRIFCDEGTVRVLSGIPEGRFVTSSQAPRDDIEFARFVQLSRVEYIVLANVQGSTLAAKMRDGEAPQFDAFEPVFHSRTVFLPTDVWLMKASEETAK
jgi:hypothetical protein